MGYVKHSKNGYKNKESKRGVKTIEYTSRPVYGMNQSILTTLLLDTGMTIQFAM